MLKSFIAWLFGSVPISRWHLIIMIFGMLVAVALASKIRKGDR